MLEVLQNLFENDVVSAEMRQEIEEAWNNKIKENKLQVTAQLREEFAQKYEHDKSVMVEAIDNMVSERLHAEMEELAEDRQQLFDAKARYVKAMKENSSLLKTFVSQSLANEIKELHSDQKSMAEKFRMLEEFVVDNLAKEITEFQTDKNDLAETKVRLVREAKLQLNKVKNTFVEKSANKVSQLVDKVLNNEISQLKEDIDVARKNDFGRRLFEAFATEYSTSYLNEKSETAKMLKVLDLKNKQLSEAKKMLQTQKSINESKQKEIQQISESVERNKIISELVSPLNKSQKEIMLDLLESVQTNRLQSSFDKYLPAVIDGKNQEIKKQETKAILKEGKEITGNREEKTDTAHARDNVIDIRRLAGLN